MPKSDAVGNRFHRPVAAAAGALEWLFYIAAALSLLTLLVSSAGNALLYDTIQIVFVIAVVLNGIISFMSKLYLSPRAAEKRRQDLLSQAFSVPLVHDKSEGYYNNDQTNPTRRLAASVMESAFFTEAVTREMLFLERIKIVVYLFAWIVAVMLRNTDLGIVSLAAQVLFGEQTLSKWLRLEWLRNRSERVYDRLHSLFATAKSTAANPSQAHVLEQYSDYEVAKATADIVLSPRAFRKRNTDLSAEWDRIRADIKV